MRILAVIVNYGRANDRFLAQVLKDRSMRYDLDIVVISNIAKDLGAGVEVMAGLPTKDPRSLPFASRKIFAERMERYDVFIHAEDDVLITEENIDSCLDATAVLPADEIAGFVHAEEDPQGTSTLILRMRAFTGIFHRSGNEASIRWLTLPMCSRHVSC